MTNDTPPGGPPDYLVIGHVTKDLLDGPESYAAGGTVLYSAITAQKLGLQAAIVTSCAGKDAPLLDAARRAGVWTHHLPSEATTTFRNTYDPLGHRTQTLHARASEIAPDAIPSEWLAARIVHLGPVAQELDPGLMKAFPRSLLGVTPQGWMRVVSGEGRVTQVGWPIPPALRDLPSNTFLVFSVEDLGPHAGHVDDYVNLAPLVAITHEWEDALLYRRGDPTAVPALSAHPIDPTGAGDVFAAALFVRYLETGDLVTSARFAHAAAACNIEGRGISAIPDRPTVERRLGYNAQNHP